MQGFYRVLRSIIFLRILIPPTMEYMLNSIDLPQVSIYLNYTLSYDDVGFDDCRVASNQNGILRGLTID